MKPVPFARRLRRAAARLRADNRAVSAGELGIIAPVLTLMGLGSIELANMVMCYMRINQVAITVADNASRAKQATATSGATMREYDVNDTLAQVDLLYPGLQVYNHGRVIMSSLERNTEGGQWIHWQRCLGTYTTGVSRYGTEGTGTTGTSLTGMGPAGNQVSADANSAIMFVEVFYQYQPLFFNVGGAPPTIYRAAAMYVRDDRDLTQIYNPTPTATVNTC